VRALVQRVKRAKVKIEGKIFGKIGQGLVVFLGIKDGDEDEVAKFLAEKIANLRIMADENEKMNLSIQDVKGEILVVSQFTLYADLSSSRRPSFIKAARPETAKQLYERFVEKLKEKGIPVKTGQFGEHMEVELINDGPVTIMIESPSTSHSARAQAEGSA
jgi:D-tyrosyl-tRNA(Tyr) deacylase